MLINKEFNISMIFIVIYSITQIVARFIGVTFSISFLLFGLLVSILTVLNAKYIKKYEAFISLNIILVIISIASVIRIMGLK